MGNGDFMRIETSMIISPFMTPTPTKVTTRRNNSPTTTRKPVATPRNMKERTFQAKVLSERSSPLEARNLEIVRTRQAIRTGGNSRVTHDYPKTPVGGRLFRFRTAWKGAHYESVVKQGLSWTWNETLPPPEIIEQESSPEMDGMLVKLRRKSHRGSQDSTLAEQVVHSSEKRLHRRQVNYRPINPERLHKIRDIQNADLTRGQAIIAKRLLDGLNRPQGRLLARTRHKKKRDHSWDFAGRTRTGSSELCLSA